MDILTLIVLSLLYLTLFVAFFWIIIFLDNYDILWNDPKTKNKYFISVLIPAFNEEKSIRKTINSVLRQDYSKNLFEVIVINDGSTDNTEKLCKEYEKKGLIKIVSKKNGGKASALNAGLTIAKGELIYVLDADSFAEKSNFKHLIGYFDNAKVAAVTSSMKVSTKNGFLQKVQWVEYMFSILMRKSMSLFNSLYVTPGPGSMYRKKVLLEIGGFSTTTLTEDMEIAFNIQNHKYFIENSLNAITYTNSPKDLKTLSVQRIRWYTGFIEDSLKYKHFYFNKDYGFLGGFLLPSNLLSTFALLFLTFYALFNSVKSGLTNISNLSAIKFDFFPMLKLPDFATNMFGINIFSIIGILFLIISLFIIYYSLKVSYESVNIRKNFLSYVLYLISYSFLMTYFWSSTLLYKLFLRGNLKGWKNGSE
ncbi:Glycosyltransferase AglE [Candidatus Tiddalikarchaeum anstoanum]|nr:Glycosyltransferase AglE [Candidatus Tiddalikarchaeum anstoanum]